MPSSKAERRAGNGPVLVVVYDFGSLSPSRLAAIAQELRISLVFVDVGSEHATEMRPVLELFGTVVAAGGAPPAAVARKLAKHDPAGIVTFSERQIPFAASLAELLELPYHSPSVARAIARKDLQRKAFRDAGIDETAHAVVSDPSHVEDALAATGLPVIVKPLVGVASRNTCIAESEAECRQLLAEFLDDASTNGSLLLEQVLVGRDCEWQWGDYMAVDCVVVDGAVHPIFVTGKFSLAPPFRERGCYIPPHEDALEVEHVSRLAAQAVAALGIRDGIADVEIKLTRDGPRVIEVNGRLGGWVDGVALRSGASSPGMLAVRSALGMGIDVAAIARPTRIAFHYIVIPPRSASTVRATDSGARLRQVAHVEHVAVYVRPGSDVSWRLGTDSAAAAVLGTAPSYAGLQATIDEIDSTDWIVYGP
jgi:biotin carboxylase